MSNLSLSDYSHTYAVTMSHCLDQVHYISNRLVCMTSLVSRLLSIWVIWTGLWIYFSWLISRCAFYLVIYLVWPHQSCWSTCAAIGLVGLQSSKKTIRDCFSCCRPFLKLSTVLAFTVWWSKLLHLLTSRSVKKCRLTSNLLLYLVSFNSWPLSLWGALW